MTKVFFDTEFTGLHKNTTLVSMGLISECGKSFYFELIDYDKNQIDDWLKENVIDNLYLNEKEHGRNGDSCTGDNWLFKGDKVDCSLILKEWFRQFKKVEIWSDCLSYDWVLFCDLFGHAFKIPENVYYIPFDLCTLFKNKGVDPDVNREEYANMKESSKKHNSLWDANVIKECYFKALEEKTEQPELSNKETT